MNLEGYQRQKERRRSLEAAPRERCLRCRRPTSVCYCGHILPFTPKTQFAILIHRDEARRAVASGRMAHLCLTNSLLLEGLNFTEHEKVNGLLSDPSLEPVVLFPSPAAKPIRELPPPVHKRRLIFVIDGTWSQAKKMWRLSENLQRLPTYALAPTQPSIFRVRKQPRAHCLSTLEAIDLVLRGLGEGPPQDNLLSVFHTMIHTQVAWEEKSGRKTVRGLRTRHNLGSS